MVAARNPRLIFDSTSISFTYEDFINSIDWNRVVLQTIAEHERRHPKEWGSVCGNCIKSILLRTND